MRVIEGANVKRIGFIYEKICDIDNIMQAITDATRHKNKSNLAVKRLLNNKEYYAYRIQKMLLNKTYKLGSDYKFELVQKNGKKRIITAPSLFPDQIIHWVLVTQLKPVFMKGMYSYNMGSVPTRGGLKGKEYIEKIYNKDKKIKYILKLDIEKFYPNISHIKLKELLRNKIKDRQVLELLDAIIDTGDDGLPIGYYTSQWLANFYLQELDHFIKEQLHIRYYVRYVDDMVLIDTNKRKLRKAKIVIDEFLNINNYHIKIKDNWQLWKIHSRPLDFLGYKFYKDKIILRNSIFLNIKRSIAKIKKRGYCTIKRARSLASLMGWLKHVKAGRNYYLNYIKPIISKKKISSIISKYDRRANLNARLI